MILDYTPQLRYISIKTINNIHGWAKFNLVRRKVEYHDRYFLRQYIWIDHNYLYARQKYILYSINFNRFTQSTFRELAQHIS
jgi:hypothetical protein